MKPRLSAEYVRESLQYCPHTGSFIWKYRKDKAKTINSRLAGKPAGTISKPGYLIIGINKVNYSAHRLAWLIVTGEWPGPILDHINGKKTDNRFANLREATATQNNFNQKTYAKSGLKGAFYHKRDHRWVSSICINGRRRNLGYFNSAEEAHAAYCYAAEKHQGEFAEHVSRV